MSTNTSHPPGLARWRGKIALVTGASSGIGAAIATSLSKAGLEVVTWARRESRLGEQTREAERSGRSMHPRAVDLRDVPAVRRAFAALRSQFGGVDVLVNAAGLGYPGNLESGDVEKWREMLDVNVLALALCTQEAVRDMRARGDDGHVFQVSSMSGHRVPSYDSAMYSASKFAVTALLEAQRQELRALGSRIRVTALSPGFVRTEFHNTYLGDQDAARAMYAKMEPLEAEDVAEMVLYVLGAPPRVAVHDVLMRSSTQVS